MYVVPPLRQEGSSCTHSYERDGDLEIVYVSEEIQGSVRVDTEPT